MTGQLLRRAREGDAEAFCQLAESCEAKLYQHAFALCRNAASAEDLASETLVEAWKSLGRFDGGCRFSTWLYAILIHRAQKFFRKQAKAPLLFDPTAADSSDERNWSLANAPDTGPLPDEMLVKGELADNLQRIVMELPAKQREVLLLRFYEEASLAEIGAALDLSVGTVKSRLHHALDKMRRSAELLNLRQAKGNTEV